jgi:mono/diheme cytochrome c family protein
MGFRACRRGKWITSALICLLLQTACGSSNAGQPDTGDPASTGDTASLLNIPFAQGDAEAGSVLYAEWCLDCHLLDGTGRDPELAQAVPVLGDEDLAYQMRLGGGNMPALALRPLELAHLVAWLRGAFPATDDTGAAGTGTQE